MSRLQEIGEQLKQKGQEYLEKIKETELYQKIDEKYGSLTPQGQKVARYGTVLVISFFLLFYPLSQLQVSSSLIAEFEAKRNLLRDLFKTYRESTMTVTLPQPPTGGSLVAQINTTLSAAQLLPEQIVSVAPIEPEGQLIPKKLVNTAVAVHLINLNLKQTVDIGTQLANISGAIKVKDLTMSAGEKTGYFDVTYKLYALNVPQPLLEAPPEIEPPSKNKKNTAPKNDAAEEATE